MNQRTAIANIMKKIVFSSVLMLSTGFLVYQHVDIPRSSAVESAVIWLKLSEEDKAVLRSRWSEKKIQEILTAIRTKKPLPVEQIPDGLFISSLGIMSEAYGPEYQDFLGRSLLIGYLLLEQKAAYRFYDLRGIPLPNSTIENADLRFAYLDGADLSKCKLKNVDLMGANLCEANLKEARLDSVNLDHAILIGADLSGAATLIGAPSSLKQAILFESKLEEAWLWGANFEGAKFADIASSQFEAFFGGIDVEQSMLRSADLSKAQLVNANLKGAILGSANLDSANLFDAMFGNTVVDVKQLEKAVNIRYLKPGESPPRVNVPARYLDIVEAYHRAAKNYFISNGMAEMAEEYHFWEQEAKTRKTETPWYTKLIRIVFMKWPYGYGSRPLWLLYYSFALIFVFATLYLLLTLTSKTSGIYLVRTENGQEKKTHLSWRRSILVADCLYFSILSFTTFGFGTLKPRQWIELFRFEPVELRPVGWVRILVGLEAAAGIYLLALLATILFGKF